ncbi:DUF5700 domain-containing putative Zn-dependent protease [Spirosoma linguale]|uniref:DUF2268 domain-containing protein n=1 Tax=Spirosoma linguale (strain ATCC 33905 / DSM 74 / LMG 10896 / Claus 1) TaxID=504472 RepID=D2QBW7_SPILD|nr:hypothetical protein Slin_3700 [Spirosoma linguale DSM 74]
MKIPLLLLCWLWAINAPLVGQPLTAKASSAKITIQLDFESAKAITHLMSLTAVTSAQLDRVAKLYGNQQLIAKIAYNNKTNDETVFKQTLRELIETGTIKGEDPFYWQVVKTNLASTTKLIDQVETKGSFQDEVKALILPYCPPTNQVTARACFLAGGGSLGFTIGDDPTFNVALQQIGDDYEGLVYMVAHELYHTVQQVGQQSRKKEKLTGEPPKSIANAYMLLENLWSEGTATLVADFTKIKEPKSVAKRQQDEYEQNGQRSRQNFVLFESLLFSAYQDSTVSPSQLYNISFTTAFDQTGYHTGYRMAKEIEAHRGKAVLAALVNQSPIEFCRVYIRLYQEHPDKINIKFSAATEAIIAKLQPWTAKL